MNTTATLIKHIIKSRKSIFPADYTETPIPEEIIEDILDIATYAPNHKKTKPWRLKAFRGEEKTALGAELQRLYKGHVPAEKFSEDTYNALAQKVAKSRYHYLHCCGIQREGSPVGGSRCCSYGGTEYVFAMYCL